VLQPGITRGAPSRALICQAVRRTASAVAGMLASSSRESGPDTLMLATTVPVRSKTGPATQHRCGSSSSALGAADYGLLAGLGLLAGTGLLTLLFRATPAYGLILIAHLATIVVCFCLAPYTRFAHSVYRLLAIVADNVEAARAR
jgi:hypothetical protein